MVDLASITAIDHPDFGKERKVADQDQNPGHKWPKVDSDEDGEKHFDSFRYTPYTTDSEFYRDPVIYETEVTRTTQDKKASTDTKTKPRGNQRTDERIQAEVAEMLSSQKQIDASRVRVEVRDGIATLSGNVKSQDEKRTAEEIATNVFGILQIHNNLIVDDQSG